MFEYPLEVNPATYSGSVVRKSDANAAHDGVIIQCPIAAGDIDPASSYTVLVDNEREGGVVEDMRVVWIGSLMDFFYLKRRSVSDRFSNANSFVTIEKTDAHFSTAEQHKIATFCRVMGIDYGEMDCLRDKSTGLIYICDINKTPAGPPNGLTRRAARNAVRRMAVRFVREVVCDGKG